MIIEKANIFDAEEILKIQKMAFISQAEIYNDFTIHPLVETLEEIKSEFENKVVFKAIINEGIVGAIRVLEKDGTAYIGKLCVQPTFQKQGIGTKLIKEVEKNFKDINRFELFTGSKSESTILLYEKLGYKKYKTERHNEKSELVYLGKYTDSSNNTTSHISTVYDGQIKNTIPYYECFHKETINLIKVAKNNPKVWLDTGCGTGSLVEQAVKQFDNTLFILADPSIGMLDEAKNKLANFSEEKIKFLEPVTTQDISVDNNQRPEVITAIQAHHYLSMEDRVKATTKCYDFLDENGIYITFENISPFTQYGIEIGKEYWKQFQVESSKSIEDAQKHMKRFGVEYFPITIEEHLNLLKSSGFRVVELFWYSYLQAGFYCVK